MQQNKAAVNNANDLSATNNGAINTTTAGCFRGANFAQVSNGNSPGTNGLQPQEFSTPNCNELSVYHFGNQIGVGAYAVVKECIHKPSGEKVAIKQYDRSKL